MIARSSHPLARLAAAAFVLRAAAALLHRFVHPLPDSSADAITFEAIGWALAQEGWGGVAGNFTLGSGLYAWVISLVYLVAWREALLPQVLNVVLGTFTVCIAYLATRELRGPGPAAVVGWVAAFWPALILYSAILLREAFVVAGLVTCVLGAAMWFRRGSSSGFGLMVAGAFVATAFHGAGLAALAAVAVAALARVVGAIHRRQPTLGRRAAEASVLALFLAAGAAVHGDPLAVAGGEQMLTIEMIAHRQQLAANADSGYLVGVISETWPEFLLQLPARILYFIVSPMPWDVNEPAYVVGMVDGLAYAGLVSLAATGVWRWRRDPVVLFMGIVTALLLLALATNTYNAGTALRHRAKLAPILLVLAMIVLAHPRQAAPGRRLLLVVNEPSVFFPNRHGLALAARATGWDVHVAGPDLPGAEAIRAAGWAYHPIPLDRRSLAPWKELFTLIALSRLLRRLEPDVLHAFTLKPILHGSLAARFAGTPTIVTVTGLGYLFIQETRKARLVRRMLVAGLSLGLDHPRATVVFQNADDREAFVRLGVVSSERTRLIPGSGVDLARFTPSPEPAGTPIVLLVARMLADKGVREFVDAARLVRARGVNARFVLVGDTDPGNPADLGRAQLEVWVEEGAVEWWGPRSDMPAVYAGATVVCLPSYREGIPRVLLEGAASGRALLATDVPGCRDVCRDGVTGLLVPPRDGAALADAAERLLADAPLRGRLAADGRALIERTFARTRIEEAQVALYEESLAPTQAASESAHALT